MRDDLMVVVYVATEDKEFDFPYSSNTSIEDLCIQVCRKLGIGPIAKYLFGLQCHSSKLWFPFCHKLDKKGKYKFNFRLRFKPSSLQRLKHIDKQAYNYYFQQARSDVMDNKVPDIVYETHKRELIGLGVSDMYRVMLEKQLPRETVESDYKKYIPKECVKRHAFFIKKPIRNALGRLSGHDASHVKEEYLKQFECMAPNYPYEEYKAFMDKLGPDPPAKILLRVKIEEVKFYDTDSREWNTLCAIEDLCFISIGQSNNVEVSRKNGIPTYLTFDDNAHLMSFVSALDGYYRLSVKWTFNLCSSVITPTLDRLHKLKCHGPVGKEFSHTKLKEKRANKAGTYMLRESESEYDVYYIDVCGADGKISTQRVEQVASNEFTLPSSTERYKSLGHLISSFQESTNPLYLAECLPPSEYDVSPLLICASETVGNEVAADEEIISNMLEGGPRCVQWKDLQTYKAFVKSDEDLGRKSPTKLYHAMWRVAKGKKLEVAMKVLKNEENNYTKEFLELAGKWGQLRSGALVRLYGITVAPTIGMLLENVQMGPLDKYLRSNPPQTIKTADMVEATTCLATALWHLEENNVVHGNIRCRKLLVHAHTANSFIVKLTDPGIFTNTEADLHWIPPECYSNLESAKRNPQADIWALATTIWEIFSRGLSIWRISPPLYPNANVVKKFYESGYRLPQPAGCPNGVYRLMLQCWGENNTSRKQPQAIMRDINQILYQVYNSRRTHAYATAFPKLFKENYRILKNKDDDDDDDDVDVDIDDNNDDIDDDDDDDDDEEDNQDTMETTENGSRRSSSNFTEYTNLSYGDTDDATSSTKLLIPVDYTEDLSSYLDLLVRTMRGGTKKHGKSRVLRSNREDSISDMIQLKNGSNNGSVVYESSLSQMQDVFELDAECNVILQGLIGQGFYGEVYKGAIERENSKEEPQLVAIKKLKTRSMDTGQRDFEREISIMKTLAHPNIVQILAVLSDPEPCLVMEFVKHGSLQSYLAINRHNLMPNRLLGFAHDIATGMDYLGSMSIVHRDLAARNILVADENRVKISDFGLAQVMGNDEYYILQTNRDLPIKWYAPESLRDGKFSTRSDVWSFGVTMYEIFSLGEDPELPGLRQKRTDDSVDDPEEGSSTKLLAALEQGARLPCPSKCPQAVYVKLMYPCWNLQSQLRPKFSTLCQDIHQLLSEY
ncbi:PREDICTED: tyrosine-protein kinase hopscotch [Dinoponera quadriceps]|uniref:Tyrosine-protein kinase n=1 Tax=Dinoponera quadriceps TaxID=609295 RepID=A0A6P3Y280_DINQU|nr:PREDICTED: tyrosine-protein kinase hopscotch [Dinoponera quadriceps]